MKYACMKLGVKNNLLPLHRLLAEAGYAFELDKKIVPIKIDKGFKPTGWLGPLIGNKMYYVMKTVDDVSRELPNIIEKGISGVIRGENHS